MPASFDLFGTLHLATVAAVAAVAIALAAVGRRLSPARFRRLCRGVAASLVLLTTAYFANEHAEGTLDWTDLVPLQLCDLAIVLAVIALSTFWRPVRELLYFWALTGTVLAIVTPDVDTAVTDPSTAFYFALHGGVVIAAVLVTWGARAFPSPRAPWRVLLATNVYAGVVAIVNAATGANFMFLSRKPAAATLLDYLGPWPLYLAAAEGVALALFLLVGRLTPTDPPRR